MAVSACHDESQLDPIAMCPLSSSFLSDVQFPMPHLRLDIIKRAPLTTVALAFRRVLLCPGGLGLVDEFLLAFVLVLRGGDLVPARDRGLV